ncbi:MAG TPA: redoxin domain-containing protein [Polyangia bacterium]|nr:redoxin domain-containing protein [Polyangia bacterium]
MRTMKVSAGLFTVLVTVLVLALGLVSAAARADVLPEAPAGPRAGQKAPAFSLKTVDSGQPRALESFTKAKGMKGAVVLFLSCRCPYVAQARAPLAELHKQYGDKVAFVGLNANQNEKADDIKADAAQSFQFPMLRDEGSKVADLYGAQRTPEAFVVDPSGVIRYHGGVADLGPALAQLVSGAPIAKAESKAFGCTIKRKP